MSLRTKSAQNKKRLLVVFDIDETLIQFIHWKEVDDVKSKLDALDPDTYVTETDSNGKTSYIIFRPHLKTLMNLFKTDPFFKPALWTYSEREYSNNVGNAIIQKYGLPEDFFLFRKGSEDIENDPDEIPKNLKMIYQEYPEYYNTFNTILIDDRYGNINNDSNRFNGIVIQPFAPFGTEKKRELLTGSKFESELNDNVFLSIINIMKKIKKDIMGCDNDDIKSAFKTEAVFSEKRIARMKLESYIQTFATKFTEIISVGVPYLTSKFMLIPPEYSKFAKRGGRRSTKKQKKQRKEKKNKTEKMQ